MISMLTYDQYLSYCKQELESDPDDLHKKLLELRLVIETIGLWGGTYDN